MIPPFGKKRRGKQLPITNAKDQGKGQGWKGRGEKKGRSTMKPVPEPLGKGRGGRF